MKNTNSQTGRWIVLLTALFFIGGCKTTGVGILIGDVVKPLAPEPGPPPHAPAKGYRAKHSYYYYPSVGVYYDIGRRSYFYLEGDRWRISLALPETLRVRLGDRVALELDTDTPYTHYDEHKKKYPPGQLKKKGKKNKWR